MMESPAGSIPTATTEAASPSIATQTTLSETPTYFPDCCVALSKPLLATLRHHLTTPTNAPILSIGSGSGLFECLLLQQTRSDDGDALNLRGVEVSSCKNIHLPAHLCLRVPRSTALHEEALRAGVLMFVYPRSVELLRRYFDFVIAEPERGVLERILWVGHRCDWEEFEGALREWFQVVELVEGNGLRECEIIAVGTRPRRPG